MGADAFQQLARYVRDVRVAEHQQIGGKPVTTIAGEIDTAGMLKAVAKLGSLSGPGGEKPAFSFDLDDLGVKIGDIKAVLSIDESTHLLGTRPRHARHGGAGQEARSSSCATGSRARTSRSSSRPSPASHYIRGMDPDRSGGCECRPSSSRRSRCSSRCGTSRARTWTPARSRCSRSSALAGIATRSGLEHRTHALRRPRVRRPARRRLGGHRRRVHRLRRLLHRRRCSLPRHARAGQRRHVPARPAHPRLRRRAARALAAPRLAAPARASTAATSSVAAARTTGRGRVSSTCSSWASPPGRPCCSSSASAPCTAGPGGARSPRSGSSPSS